MKPKFVCSLMAVAVLMVSAVAAQTSSNSSAALPAAPGATNDPPAAFTPNPNAKAIAAINVEGAIFNTNEGQRDMEVLQKKFEPKSNELKGDADEIDAMKKKLNTSSEDAKVDLQRQIENKQKQLERETQDAREDFQTQQNEIGQRILQKMAQLIVKYANDNGYGIIIDTSQQWPQGPVLWVNPTTVDITKPIIDAYNAQSGIAPPAPRTGSTSRPAGGSSTHSATGTSKPATTPSK
jgi:outer membrane protein